MHRRDPRAQGGFTLLEILVVVVIIGILTAMLLPNLNAGGRWRDLNREAATLAARILVAQDDAMLRGREYGIAFSPEGYRFVVWDPASSAFVDIVDPGARWTVRFFDEGITIAAAADRAEPILTLPAAEEDAAAGNAAGDNAPAPATYAPTVFVLSSGEVTPFTAQLRADGEERAVEVRIDALGNREADDTAPGAAHAASP